MTIDHRPAQPARAGPRPTRAGGPATSSSRPSSASPSASSSGPGASPGRPSSPSTRLPRAAGLALRGLAGAGRARAADHPQARRGPLRRDGRGRRVGAPRERLGRRHAPVGLRPGRGRRARLRVHRCTASGRSRCSPRRRSPARRRPGSTTGCSTTRRSAVDLQIVRGVAMAISAVVFVALGSVAVERSLRRAGVLEGFRGLSAHGPRPRRRGPIRACGRGFTLRRGADGRRSGTSTCEVEPGARAARRRAVGLGQEHARAGDRRPDPERVPGEWQGSLRVGDLEVARRAGRDAPPLDVRGWAPGSCSRTRPASSSWSASGTTSRSGSRTCAWPLVAMRARVPEALDGRRAWAVSSGGGTRRGCRAGSSSASPSRACWRPPPAVLVLDEPTANLDPDGATAVFGILAGIRSARAATIVLVEHRADLAWPLADLVLALGEDGAPDRRRAARPTSWPAPARSSRRRASGCPTIDRGATGRGGTAAGAGSGGWVRSRRAPGRSRPSSSQIEHAPLRVRPRRDRSCATIDLRSRPASGSRSSAPNGSGKSTLLRLVVGLLRPRRRVRSARRPRPVAPARRQVARLAGYVFQEPELGFLADTVPEEVELGPDAGAGRVRPTSCCERLGLPLASSGSGARIGSRAASSAGSRWRRRSSAAAAPARPRRADVRPGPARLRGPGRRARRAGGAGERGPRRDPRRALRARRDRAAHRARGGLDRRRRPGSWSVRFGSVGGWAGVRWRSRRSGRATAAGSEGTRR